MSGQSALVQNPSLPTKLSGEHPAAGPLRALASPQVLWLLGLAVFVLYGCLHFVVTREASPLTVREQAFVDSVRHLKEVGFADFYSYDAVPLRANLYGPLYPLLVSFVAAPEVDPYVVHRVVVAVFLVAACLVLASGLPAGTPLLSRVLAAAFLYAAHVASPSLAAGPDTLMLAVYVVCIVLLGRLKAGVCSLLVATIGVVLLFFSKPYGILVWGGYVSYLMLFRSWKWAFANLALALSVALLLAVVIEHFWPAYRFSVLGIHAFFATWSFSDLVAQVRDFAFYHFSLLILAACGLWPVIRHAADGRSWIGAWRSLRECPPSFPLWMTLVATVALVGRLGWHGGAYLIYFNHLLLPPLLWVAFGEAPHRKYARQWWARGIVAMNLALVLYLLPPWPEARAERFLPTLGVAWVDPALEAWALQQPMVEVIDNAQSEYLVFAGARSSDPEIRRRVQAWLSTTGAKLASGDVRYVVLSTVHDRPLFEWNYKPTPFFHEHFRLVHAFTTHPYYLAFRDRRNFGRIPLIFKVYEHRRFKEDAAVDGAISP